MYPYYSEIFIPDQEVKTHAMDSAAPCWPRSNGSPHVQSRRLYLFTFRGWRVSPVSMFGPGPNRSLLYHQVLEIAF